jgi:hypothetical protein
MLSVRSRAIHRASRRSIRPGSAMNRAATHLGTFQLLVVNFVMRSEMAGEDDPYGAYCLVW